jgi:predicted AAA+ superfamily ATPase
MRALNDPRGFLADYPKRSIIDEVQRVPELLSYLQTVLDSSPEAGQYILTGSQNFILSEAVSQTLVGRTSLHTLLPLTLHEIWQHNAMKSVEEVLWRGQYPALYAANDSAVVDSSLFYESYVALYLERDLRDMRHITDLALFWDFMALVAGRAGQQINYSDLAGVLGRDATTIKAWYALLETSYIVFKLRPYSARLSRRLSKAPKYYFYDTGLLCHLLGIRSVSGVEQHYAWGHIFENFVIAERFKELTNMGQQPRFHFLRDKLGNEVDMVEETPQGLTLTEIKAARTFSKDMLKGLDVYQELSKQFSLQKRLIYRGEAMQYKDAVVTNMHTLTPH